MQRVGIADLGSNTARLVVFEYEPGSWFQMIDSVREPVRLGEGLARDGRLAPEAIQRALAAVELFEDYASAVGLDDLEILATSAVRDAANSAEVLEPIRRAGYSVRVLPGEEEAELGVLAIANSFAVRDGWVMDLGGGSAQVSQMVDRGYSGGRAYPLGAVRLTERFLAGDPPSRDSIEALEAQVARELGPVAGRISDSALPMLAMGGTARSLAKIAQRSVGYGLPVLHGFQLTRVVLEEIVEVLASQTLEERSETAGLRPDRADIILAGALVYRWVLRHSGLEAIIISGHGVREGALYRHVMPHPHLLEEVRSFSVRNLARRHPQPSLHVRQVERLATCLFDGLAPLHGLGAPERDLLAVAAELHDVGVSLDYYRHEKHGEYILTSSALPGFDHRELALISLLVRYHRKGTPRARGYSDVLNDEDLVTLGYLTACLRTAESLERARAGRVKDVCVEVEERAIRLTVVAEEEPTVELWEAGRHESLFEEVFGRALIVEARVL